MKFNSLGSNYHWRAVKQALKPFFYLDQQQLLSRVRYLAGDKKQQLNISFFYKGREALLAALVNLRLPSQAKVGVVGFTCVVVAQAVQKANLQVVFLPVDKSTLNFDYRSLPTDLQALIIQNTLGYPQPQMAKIMKFCQRHHIVIIEDLAHSAGAVYDCGLKAGQVGREIIYSSSQDKLLDSVAGGIWLSRQLCGELDFSVDKLPFCQQLRDYFYPLFTWLVRSGYQCGWGKCLHFLLKKLKLLSQPMNYFHHHSLTALSRHHRYLLNQQLAELSQSLKRRRQVLLWYYQELSPACLLWPLNEEILQRLSPLRLPISVPVELRESIWQALVKKGYHCRDTWYDTPLAPVSAYEQLPNLPAIKKALKAVAHTQQFCQTLMNLPVHQDISHADVKQIAQIINQILI